MSISIRPIEQSDFPHILAMNNTAIPAVNLLDADALVELVGFAHAAVALVDDSAGEAEDEAADEAADAVTDAALGFVITLTAGNDYASENYRWFEARGTEFLYVDRIVVAPDARGRGLGQVLYERVFAEAVAAGLREVTCEVNLDPPNPRSLAFHDRLGFVQVGELVTKNDTVTVALLAAPVPDTALVDTGAEG